MGKVKDSRMSFADIESDMRNANRLPKKLGKRLIRVGVALVIYLAICGIIANIYFLVKWAVKVIEIWS